MTHPNDPLAGAQETARAWLAVVAERLGTQDREYAYRVLRAWLHLVRDRLTVNGAVHLGAQLPELLRGVYYEGWIPERVPVRYDAAEFTQLFAEQARVRLAEVPGIVGAISGGLGDLFSPGQLEHVLVQLPAGLRSELEPARNKV
jgi:uncharacterized protein (DUF2267 family)